ncbi:11446_t:CDS:2 [Funneliformis mosseae]|uniref:11446_t:CDS:1 n=1 Tax=Funneliformis mosseae TaxID=27381 RepID=A0A9N9FKH7_FUNMO|nr:11446_t:CDS:2 [Funneliformis mosseae]
MNPSRKSKKRAIEKINTISTNTKKTHNNQEIRGRKKKVQETEIIDNRKSNTIKGTEQSYKSYKGKKVITSQPQIIDELLNDSDSSNEDNNDVLNEGNNNSNEDDNRNNNDVLKENSDKAYEAITSSRPIPILEKEATRLMSALKMETNRRSISVLEEIISRLSKKGFLRLNSRSLSDVNSQDDNYFTPSKRRTNSPNYYDPSNRALYSKPIRLSPLSQEQI